MISAVLAMLVMAPPSADVINRARLDYTRCLRATMKTSLKEKIDVAAFEAAVVPACAAKAQVLRTAIVAADTAAGIKRTAAEENASADLEDILLNTRESYADYLTSNTLPQN
jgi:hypothetical protein